MAILARLRTLTTDTGPMNFTILFMDIITIRLVFSKCIRGGVETFFPEDSINFTIRPRSTDRGWIWELVEGFIDIISMHLVFPCCGCRKDFLRLDTFSQYGLLALRPRARTPEPRTVDFLIFVEDFLDIITIFLNLHRSRKKRFSKIYSILLHGYVGPALGPELLIKDHEFHNFLEGFIDITTIYSVFLTNVD